jgi:hypothetical protein
MIGVRCYGCCSGIPGEDAKMQEFHYGNGLMGIFLWISLALYLPNSLFISPTNMQVDAKMQEFHSGNGLMGVFLWISLAIYLPDSLFISPTNMQVDAKMQ